MSNELIQVQSELIGMQKEMIVLCNKESDRLKDLVAEQRHLIELLSDHPFIVFGNN